MVEYTLSAQAEADLRDIWRFIACDNAQAATKVVEAAYATFATLAKSPRMGRLRPIASLPESEIRSWFVTGFNQYLIFYRVIEKGIDVLRVYHAARDIESLFSE